MTGRGEVLADLITDLRAGIERHLATTPEPALHWRPAREMNSIGDTVWHVARWLDLCDSWLRNAAPETQHWIADGWAERTGYDPRGVGTDGLGVLSGYGFAEVVDKLAALFDEDPPAVVFTFDESGIYGLPTTRRSTATRPPHSTARPRRMRGCSTRRCRRASRR